MCKLHYLSETKANLLFEESHNIWHSVYGLKAACLTQESLEWQDYQFYQMKQLEVNGSKDIPGSIKWKDDLLGKFLVWYLEVQSPFQLNSVNCLLYLYPMPQMEKEGD